MNLSIKSARHTKGKSVGPDRFRRIPSASIDYIKEKAKKVGRPVMAASLALSAQVYDGGSSEVKADNYLPIQGTLSSHDLDLDPFGKTNPDVSILVEPRLTELEEKQITLELERQDVIRRAETDPHLSERFNYIWHLRGFTNEKYIEDLKIYYPIYKTVADKYNFDWTLLWVIHETETKASDSHFMGSGCGGTCVNGFQRHYPSWPQDVVDQAAEGLEHLAVLPQRHPDDWKEAAFAAYHLTSVPSRPHSAEEGVYFYGGHASNRLQILYSLQQVFD